jgi:hypothetical protein
MIIDDEAEWEISHSMKEFLEKYGEMPKEKYVIVPDNAEDAEVAAKMTKMLNYVLEYGIEEDENE